MKQEIVTQLVKELFNSVNELHQEYQDNKISYVIDTLKDGDTLNITISLNKNKDKEEFQNWCDSLPDDIFEEVWESLSNENDLYTLNEIYESENYQEIIDRFKEKTQEILKEKINEYNKLLG